MSFKPFKKIGKALKKTFNPQTLLYAGVGFIVGGPMGASIGAGLGASSQGAFGHTLQDISTMGASAQMRANQRLANIYNEAQQVQANAIAEQNQRALLQQIRSARIQRAQALTDYAGETGVTSSGALGNLSSIGSQQLSNTTYSVRQGRYQNQYQTIMNMYNAYQTKTQNNQIKWNNIRQTASLALNAYGTFYNPAAAAGTGATTQAINPYQGINVSYGV